MPKQASKTARLCACLWANQDRSKARCLGPVCNSCAAPVICSEMQNTVAPSLPRTPGTLSLAEDEHLLLGVLIPQHLNDSLGLQRGRVAGAAEQASHK